MLSGIVGVKGRLLTDKEQKSAVDTDVSREYKYFKNIVVTGVTGSGKSALAWQLAKLMGLGFIDLDAFIEVDTGQTVKELFQEFGEAGFRQIESDMIEKLNGISSHVISVGGGAVADDSNLIALKNIGVMVWVKAPLERVAKQLAMKPSEIEKRPLIEGAMKLESKSERIKFIDEKLAELLKEREKYYSQSDIIFLSDYSTPELSAQQIKFQLTNSDYRSASSSR